MFMTDVKPHRETLYYYAQSIKVWDSMTELKEKVERKLPPICYRFFLLYRLFLQKEKPEMTRNGAAIVRRPKANDHSVRQVIMMLFDLDDMPTMTQIRHLFTSVSNVIMPDKDWLTKLSTARAAAKA